MRLVGALVACLLLGTSLVSCQSDCALPTNSDIANVIESAIPSGDNPVQPQITLLNVRHVCRAFSEERGRYRLVSVLVEYMCEGSALCPDGTVTEQFAIGCDSGNWTNSVRGNTANIRTENPTATFSTELREDCSFCFSPELADSITAPPPDEETHCLSCVGCSENPGQNACFLNQPEQCCNVYVDNMCDTECPDDAEYNIDPENFDCVLAPTCPNLGDTVENGEVTYSRDRQSSGRYSAGTTATVVCAEGYRGGDITCQTDASWSDALPSCTIIDCGSPPTLDNGRIVMQNTTTFGSIVTYECNENYFFDDGTKPSRTCLSRGWSNEDIRCKACELPGCKICEVVDNQPTCVECSDNYEKRGDSCEKACEIPGCKICEVVDNQPTCVECSDNYEKRGDSCEKACEIPGCKICEVVDNQPTCVECSDNYEKRGDSCEKACELPGCKNCEVVDNQPTCVDCADDFEKRGDSCEEIRSGGGKKGVCIICIVIPIAILLAIILAVAVAVAVYAYYRWKRAPATNLKEKDAEGINGVAKDNPLYLDPNTVAEEAEE